VGEPAATQIGEGASGGLAGALISKEPKNPKIQQTLVLSVILEITKRMSH
jgi:hypothetical protein